MRIFSYVINKNKTKKKKKQNKKKTFQSSDLSYNIGTSRSGGSLSAKFNNYFSKKKKAI